ncbi:hypothetical protein F5X99DRAFT_381717 [Biscogniauxia marginata]|nr:hypothetical protein F5X99DRAFT_381717 [Biscogniauxia marginata]
MTYRRREEVFITLLRSVYSNTSHGPLRVPRPATKLPSMRRLSTLLVANAALQRSIGSRELSRRSARIARGRRQSYATIKASDGTTRNIAILGGGITGLTTAHYLVRHATNVHITIYEAANRLGGWIDAEHVSLGKGNRSDVLLQRGPRMLRSGNSSIKYDDLVLYDVIANLELKDKIRHPKTLSNNRYLFYPDHLVKLPSAELSLSNIIGTIWSFLTDSLWDGCVKAGLNLLRPSSLPARPTKPHPARFEQDESIGQYFTRRMGDDRPVKNIVSGMIHGIYGGDVYKLSAKHSVFDAMWYQNVVPVPSNYLWSPNKDMYLMHDMLNSDNRWKLVELAEQAIGWNTFMFEDGLMSLVDGLVRDLENRSNVTIKYNEPVTSLRYDKSRVSVTTTKSREKPHGYDQVISTLFSKHLSQLALPPNSLPSLAETHAVTIMVVNLWYPNSKLLDSNHGFGYLVPSSTPDNEECVLGVLFDSDLQIRPETPATKLTVMLGGHHWDDWEHLPSEELGIQMAVQAVKKQLGIDENEEVHASAHLCRDCLPQHFIGHRERMSRAHYELLATFKGRLTVAGPSYTNIGVIPAMRAGFDVAMRVAQGHGPPWFPDPEPTPDRDKNDQEPQLMPQKSGFWGDLLKLHKMAGEKVLDHVGATGLEGFTEPLAKCMKPLQKGSFMFRKWTPLDTRLTDDQGRWLPQYAKNMEYAVRETEIRISEKRKAKEREWESTQKMQGEKGGAKGKEKRKGGRQE